MKGKYNITNIKKGDLVFFERIGIDNFDLYWTVIDIVNGMIEVEIDEMGHKEKIFIDIADVKYLKQ